MGYLHDILLRFSEMEIEALTTLTSGKVDAKPFFPYSQESFPYFYNQIATGNYSQSATGMDYVAQRRIFNIYLVVAHLTEGYRGESQEKVDEYIPAVVEYFTSPAHQMLQSATYPTRAPYLLGSLNMVSDGGIRVFNNGGLQDTLQIGVQFVVELNIIRQA